jgi:hypothetical protein
MKKLYILTENKSLGIEQWMFISEFNHIEYNETHTRFISELPATVLYQKDIVSEVSIPNARIYKFE